MFSRTNLVCAAMVVVVMGLPQLGRSQDAPGKLIRKAYDVGRIVADGDEADLVDLVTSVIQPEKWDCVGGSGRISVVKKHQLEVFQNQAAHAELARLLDALTKMPGLKQNEPAARYQPGRQIIVTDGKLAPNSPALIVYDVTDLVPTGDYHALVSPIVGIEPTTWDTVGGPGVIVPVPAAKALVIVQTGDVHRQLQDWLRRQRRQSGNDQGKPTTQN
ncbi:MAG: hypothetical protein KJ000_33695 [Pirellulaceae bacterium]|nr:hypothetical protein [Pirellulaceae bacterium]